MAWLLTRPTFQRSMPMVQTVLLNVWSCRCCSLPIRSSASLLCTRPVRLFLLSWPMMLWPRSSSTTEVACSWLVLLVMMQFALCSLLLFSGPDARHRVRNGPEGRVCRDALAEVLGPVHRKGVETEWDFFQPSMANSCCLSRARGGGDAGSLTPRCSATVIGCGERSSCNTLSEPPPPTSPWWQGLIQGGRGGGVAVVVFKVFSQDGEWV